LPIGMNKEASLSVADELFARAERIHSEALRLNEECGIAVGESLKLLHRTAVRHEITMEVLGRAFERLARAGRPSKFDVAKNKVYPPPGRGDTARRKCSVGANLKSLSPKWWRFGISLIGCAGRAKPCAGCVV